MVVTVGKGLGSGQVPRERVGLWPSPPRTAVRQAHLPKERAHSFPPGAFLLTL